jgi:hypothetical protein
MNKSLDNNCGMVSYHQNTSEDSGIMLMVVALAIVMAVIFIINK